MISDSKASLAYAFYAYIPPFRIVPASNQPLLNEASNKTITLQQIVKDAHLQSLPTANCPSSTLKRKREDNTFHDAMRKRRNFMHMNTDWEMIDV